MLFQTDPKLNISGVMLDMNTNQNQVDDHDAQQVIVQLPSGVYKGMTLTDENGTSWLNDLRDMGGRVLFSRQPVQKYPGCQVRVWGKWWRES
jgi:hypothetical protein